MRRRFSLLLRAVGVCCLLLPLAAPSLAARMRPYAGIGVLLLPLSPTPAQETFGELPLYQWPSLGRLGALNRATAPSLEWLLDLAPESAAVMVMARQGAWLRVTYDEAGREGWVRPHWRNAFESWDEILVGRDVRQLAGLQQRYYRLYSGPDGEPLAELGRGLPFRVGERVGDWLRVSDGRDLAGWLRWRDEDGRLLIALVPDRKGDWAR